ncbi:MAG: histidine phosphatase family protein [Bacteroidales bacterium]|nr:histidine phosphatase family protein [Bacteroidales bacterium]
MNRVSLLRNCAIIFSSLTIGLNATAQTAFEELKENPQKAGGVYYAYPGPTSTLTDVPEGYEPFYISHYGRHGSRYLLNDNDYKRVLDILRKADEMNVLTETGKSALSRMEEIWKEAEFHGDELAPLGKRQHRGIAERMYSNYPQVFKGNSHITARSTTSMRVAISMMAFCERLKELNSQLDIDWETSRKNMSYLNYHTKRYEDLKRDRNGWTKKHGEFCSRGINPDRFTSQLVTDTAFFRQAKVHPSMLMSGMFEIAIDLQDMETEVSLFDLYTPEEIFECWRNGNSWFYHCDADSPHNQGTAIESTRNLLANFVERADLAIEGKGESATLRFGHDGNIIPLAAIMQLKDCDAREEDIHSVDKVWHNYYVSPMAANIQLIFFKNAKGDVILKFLHNENETSIPVKTDMFPYYHWNDVRAFFMSKLDK